MSSQDTQQPSAYTPGPIDDIIVSTLKSIDRSNFGSKDKILFFKEISYLLSGGVSLVDAMNIIGSSSDNYALKEISLTILDFLNKGKSFSYALNRLPDYFDQGDYTIVKAGEMSGNLPLILQSLATEYVYIKEMKNKYIGALIYPIILIVISIVAVFALFLLVLPNIFEIATSYDTLQLPWITRALHNVSLFFQTQRKLLIGVIVGLGLVGGVAFSTDVGKKARFNLLLSIPLIGKMTKYFYIVKFCRYMKLMMHAGMNYVQTFQLLRDILGLPAYTDMIDRVLVGLEKGDTIYHTLQYETQLIPGDVSVMIKVGEETANLSNSLDNILKMYEEDLNTLIARSSKIIEPVMLVFIGGIIVVIALGIFGLIFQIMEGSGM